MLMIVGTVCEGDIATHRVYFGYVKCEPKQLSCKLQKQNDELKDDKTLHRNEGNCRVGYYY